MQRIKVMQLQIQVMELLRNSILDTIDELETEMSATTVNKLKSASQSLHNEIHRSAEKLKVYKDPKHNETLNQCKAKY